LAIYTELNDRPGQALMLQHLGHCYKALRQPARAAELFERALAMQASRPSPPAYQSVFTNKMPDGIFAVQKSEQFETALAIYRGARRNAATTHEKIRSFYHPESFLRSRTSKTCARRPYNVPMRSVRVLHPYRAPEQSAFCWGAVPCPFSPTGLAPWVLRRMEHIRSMDYPAMQQQMLDFVDMVIDLSAQQRRKKRAYSHIDSSNPELWPLSQVALECRQSVEFWTVFSTVLDYFSELPAGPPKK
jgi:hypothetical protein